MLDGLEYTNTRKNSPYSFVQNVLHTVDITNFVIFIDMAISMLNEFSETYIKF